MADNFNHKNVSVIWELVNEDLHIKGDHTGPYYAEQKFMNDFSPLFKDKEPYQNAIKDAKTEEEKEKVKRNLYGHFDRDLYNQNTRNYGLKTWLELSETKDIWYIPFIQEATTDYY